MPRLEMVLDSLRGLGRHKLRILLTMLGIVFGVAAVIAMLAIGEGAKREALAMIELMGLHNVIAEARSDLDEEEVEDNLRKSRWLTRADGEAIAAVVPGVLGVSGKRLVDAEALFPRVEDPWRVVGVGAGHLAASGLRLDAGRFFGAEEDDRMASVAVLGRELARGLFGNQGAVGRQVRVDLEWFTVIGVVHQPRPGGSAARVDGYEVDDADHDLFIPLGAALGRFDSEDVHSEVDQLVVRFAPDASVSAGARVMERLLDRLHRGVDDYHLVVPLKLLEQSQKTQELFNLVMALIAGISLLVGGIGIMNIMLASVLERTREIGIRRAVGASQGDILQLFLTEAILICVFGGVVGIGVGFGIARLISVSTGWKTAVTGTSVAVSFLISVGIGLVFGSFPARRAARLDPIEALRHDG